VPQVGPREDAAKIAEHLEGTTGAQGDGEGDDAVSGGVCD
jgi:hypothetical protein